MIFSCLAIGDDYQLLKTASFRKLTVKEITGKFNRTVEINIGLTAATIDNAFNPDIGDKAVITFDHFCDAKGFGLENYMNVENCNACNEVSKGMVTSSIISVVSFLPTIFTDILRMYSGYDVNCQKCFGTVIAFVSIISALSTIQSYTASCSDKFYNGIVVLDSDFNALPLDEDPATGEYFIEYDHTWNIGFTLLVAGTLIKFFDIIFHILIATPTITRNRQEQEEYEKIPEGQFV